MNNQKELNYLENINCLLCGSNQSTTLLSKSIDCHVFDIVKCKCEFVYLNPRPNDFYISIFYDNDYLPHNTNRISWILRIAQKITFYWKKSILLNFSPISRNILDIGSGDGSFCNYMNKNEWKTLAYDKFASNKSNFNFDTKFKNITMWHSLEHIHNIDDVFNKINSSIDNNGKLYIALPNFNSLDRIIFNKDWIAYDVPRHLYHFTPKTISLLLDQNNYKIISSYPMYQDTIFNVFNSFNNKFFKFIFSPFIIFFIFIAIFINKNYSSSILYICQKK